MCKIKVCELVLGAVILVFAFLQVMASKWVVIIASLLLIIHSFIPCRVCCCNDGECEMHETPIKSTKAKRK